MSFQVIQMSELDVWRQAAKAAGGYHKAKIKVAPDPERVQLKEIKPEDCGITKKPELI